MWSFTCVKYGVSLLSLARADADCLGTVTRRPCSTDRICVAAHRLSWYSKAQMSSAHCICVATPQKCSLYVVTCLSVDVGPVSVTSAFLSLAWCLLIFASSPLYSDRVAHETGGGQSNLRSCRQAFHWCFLQQCYYSALSGEVRESLFRRSTRQP